MIRVAHKSRKVLIARYPLGALSGHDITVATPWAERREDKSDFADVAHDHGFDAVRERVEVALSRFGLQRKRHPLIEGEQKCKEMLADFFAAAADHVPDADGEQQQPIVWGAKLELGLAKRERPSNSPPHVLPRCAKPETCAPSSLRSRAISSGARRPIISTVCPQPPPTTFVPRFIADTRRKIPEHPATRCVATCRQFTMPALRG